MFIGTFDVGMSGLVVVKSFYKIIKVERAT